LNEKEIPGGVDQFGRERSPFTIIQGARTHVPEEEVNSEEEDDFNPFPSGGHDSGTGGKDFSSIPEREVEADWSEDEGSVDITNTP